MKKNKLGFQMSQQSSTIDSKQTAQISLCAIHLDDNRMMTYRKCPYVTDVKKYTHMDSSQNKPKHTAYNLASSITQFMYKKRIFDL
jgi:hypothetical protein